MYFGCCILYLLGAAHCFLADDLSKTFRKSGAWKEMSSDHNLTKRLLRQFANRMAEWRVPVADIRTFVANMCQRNSISDFDLLKVLLCGRVINQLF